MRKTFIAVAVTVLSIAAASAAGIFGLAAVVAIGFGIDRFMSARKQA